MKGGWAPCVHRFTPIMPTVPFFLLAAFCFSLYTVFSKEVTRRHDSLTVNALGYVAGALAGAPLLAQQSIGFDYAGVAGAGWLALAYMTLLASIACYLIFYYALDHLPASRLAAFSYLQPVIAAATDMAWPSRRAMTSTVDP